MALAPSWGAPYRAYRSMWWPHSAGFEGIDFALTGGGQPDPDQIEAALHKLGMAVRRRHYLLEPLPMVSGPQRVVVDAVPPSPPRSLLDRSQAVVLQWALT